MPAFARLVLTIVLALACSAGPAATAPIKTLRIAFAVAETGFDPAQIFDSYSLAVTTQIFESLYAYDYLAVPAKIRPLTATAMPEHSPDFRVWTIKLQPGIRFTPDPAFKGRRRELVAQDYVYSYKRFADPAIRSQHWSAINDIGITGLAAQRQKALDTKKPFDYDAEISGLRALDRYTLQFRLDASRPRFVQSLVGGFRGALAREVVEAYRDTIMEHPVGTGPFMLGAWRRSSQIVLERNPDFRNVVFDAEPAAGDALGQSIVQRLKGRRLPMIDRVEISIIEASQPRWLSFVDGRIDEIEMPPDYVTLALPGGRLAPYLQQRGIEAQVVVSRFVSYVYFNMVDPLVGGYTPEKVALRRAIGLGMDVERQIRLLRGGQALVAQSPVSANITGYDPSFRSENGQFDRARANALLDVYGYRDRDGDGWREQPDGTPLVLVISSEPQESRRSDELTRVDLQALGLRVRFAVAQWPENAKAAQAGTLMIWQLGYGAVKPDGLDSLERFYGPAAGAANLSRFDLPAMNALYERMLALPDGPERDALFDQAKRIAVAYMPEKTTVHRMYTYLNQPWLIGYRQLAYQSGWYQMVDLEPRVTP